ncbi:hypothetical protein GUJ93_ZPchr0012g20214 [Zizania palustris]|uniref:Uncharacterized protein n=1 Tax=Zizania palustris TaxID=103762 RepID=A0A8J6BVT1_ZIZPA|nr:hypothetical protein GUJ93_ZPchr0012g20214 [Zizania palustris]
MFELFHFQMCNYSSMDGGFFTARPIWSSYSRREAPSIRTSPQVRRQTEKSLRSPTSYPFCSVELRISVLPARRLPMGEDDHGGRALPQDLLSSNALAHGGCLLTTASYASLNGILYCQNHFWKLAVQADGAATATCRSPPRAGKNNAEPKAAEPAKDDPDTAAGAAKEDASPEHVA